MDASLALFRRHPGLRGRLPHHPLLAGPTPVAPFPLDGAAALARRSRRLLTTGGLGTNHGLATTLLAREAGIETTLVLVDQPVTDSVREQLRLYQGAGARLRYGGSVAGAVVKAAAELARSTAAGERPLLIPTGGTSSRGNLGFVSAGYEIADQVAAGLLPEPERVFVPIGSGGTLAGLVVGLRLAGLTTRVVGVLVTDLLPPSPARLARLARATLRRLRRLAPEVPALAISSADFDYVSDQVGRGYGAASPAGDEARAAAAALGVKLDPTYSAKALAGLRAAARDGILAGPTLFWNTYNGVDVREKVRMADAAELPAPFQKFFDEAGS